MTATRWWWVRHAPVGATGGRIYGRSDPSCDVSDAARFAALARALPKRAALLVSPLRRTAETASAIAEAGLALPPALVEPDFIEQDFGAWTGRPRAEVFAELGPRHSFWQGAGEARPPGGETFAELCRRVGAAIRRRSEELAGRDIVSVSHAGVVRAALALALELEPGRALAFVVDTCSVTRLDRILGEDGREQWSVACVNRTV